MTLVTDLIQRYRFALREIWNTYFWTERPAPDWDSLKVFNELKLPLFAALVASRLQTYVPPPTRIFGPDYRVVPRTTGGHEYTISSLRVDAGLPSGPGSRWDRFERPFHKQELQLSIIDFFDWDQLSWKDFPDFRVRIHMLAGHPEFEGRDGLINCTEVDVVWDPASS